MFWTALALDHLAPWLLQTKVLLVEPGHQQLLTDNI
jgi:hypothetical protein